MEEWTEAQLEELRRDLVALREEREGLPDTARGRHLAREETEEPGGSVPEPLRKEEIMAAKKIEYGQEAGEQYTDLREAGIIDPAKVTGTALPSAASEASMLLTTEAVMVEDIKDGKKGPGFEGGGRP
ncbi:MAG: hypothetical protein SCH98_17220 [Deferrisomatales bacterium]|nr:hypothetical protein [Deferrisomatales bacterium]